MVEVQGISVMVGEGEDDGEEKGRKRFGKI